MNLYLLSLAFELRDQDARDVARRLDPRWGMGQAAELARWAVDIIRSKHGLIVCTPNGDRLQLETKLDPASVFDAAAHLFEVCANGAFWNANAYKPFVDALPRSRVRPLLLAFRDACQEGDVAALEALIWWCGEAPAGLDAAGLEPDRYDWPDDDHGPGEAHERGGP